MSKSNRLAASLEGSSHFHSQLARSDSSPVAGRAAAIKYRTPDPCAGGGKPAAPNPTATVEARHAAEMARMLAKEAVLLKMLNLERERKVRAEQLVQVERMACLKLQYLRKKYEESHDIIISEEFVTGSGEEEGEKEMEGKEMEVSLMRV